MICLPCTLPTLVTPAPHPAAILQRKSSPGAPAARPPHPATVAQPKAVPPTRMPGATMVAQRVNSVKADDSQRHAVGGDFYKSEVLFDSSGTPPVIIELLEPTAKGALEKIEKLAKAKVNERFPVAFIVGLNAKYSGDLHGTTTGAKQAVRNALASIHDDCKKVATLLEKSGLAGGAFPILWTPTAETVGGYAFPYLECRSLLTLHPGSRVVHDELSGLRFVPVIRSMDSDVSDDPLVPESPFIFNLGQERVLLQGIEDIGNGVIEVFSGGYEWKFDDVDAALLQRLDIIDQWAVPTSEPLVMFLRTLIADMNIHELEAREELARELGIKAVYLPEPNVYMSLAVRIAGAKASQEEAMNLPDKSQQRESTYYVKQNIVKTGDFKGKVATKKPLKTYFDAFLKFFAAVFANPKEILATKEIALSIADIRQSHLDPRKMGDILGWHSHVSVFVVNEAKKISNKHLGRCVKDFQELITGLG